MSEPLEREDIGDVTILRIKEPMLLADGAAERVFDSANAVVDTEGRARLVLNFALVVFMASMALGRLVALMRRTQAAGGRLALCDVPRTIEGLLQVSRLTDILLNYHDEREAVGSFR